MWLLRRVTRSASQAALPGRGSSCNNALARRYGISRKTAYKWIERYEIGGPAGLIDRSRRAAHCPHRTPPAIIAALLEVRRHHPPWGAKKLLKVVSTRQTTWTLPAWSTVCDLLDRAGLITAPGRRRPAYRRTRRNSGGFAGRTGVCARNVRFWQKLWGTGRAGGRAAAGPGTFARGSS